MAAVSVIPVVLDYFEDDIVRAEILPKTRTVYEQVNKLDRFETKIQLFFIKHVSLAI